MRHFVRSVQPGDFAVIFCAQRTTDDGDGYNLMGDRMMELAQTQPGYVGVESARGADGFGITVSYWESEEAIGDWKANAEHQIAQQLGREKWYSSFELRVCRVERSYGTGGNG
ncbi:antibiotic biosynthesis monooxygenase [bacterium]|nr:antibiotic biosynthesis monooxygenase [bacterium]